MKSWLSRALGFFLIVPSSVMVKPASAETANFAQHIFGENLEKKNEKICLAIPLSSRLSYPSSNFDIVTVQLSTRKTGRGALTYHANLRVLLKDGKTDHDVEMSCWPSGPKGNIFHCFIPSGANATLDLSVARNGAVLAEVHAGEGVFPGTRGAERQRAMMVRQKAANCR